MVSIMPFGRISTSNCCLHASDDTRTLGNWRLQRYNININISLQYQRQSTLLFSSNHQGPSSKQRTADAITSELDITHNFRSIIDKEYVDISAFAIKSWYNRKSYIFCLSPKLMLFFDLIELNEITRIFIGMQTRLLLTDTVSLIIFLIIQLALLLDMYTTSISLLKPFH